MKNKLLVTFVEFISYISTIIDFIVVKQKYNKLDKEKLLSIFINDVDIIDISDSNDELRVLVKLIVIKIKNIKDTLLITYDITTSDEFIFSLCASSDELILNSDIKNNENLKLSLIETNFFNTSLSGQIIIEKIYDSINSNKRSNMSLIYYFMLQIGYRGAYTNNQKGLEIINNRLKIKIKEIYELENISSVIENHSKHNYQSFKHKFPRLKINYTKVFYILIICYSSAILIYVIYSIISM